MRHQEISKEERKAWNKHVREQKVRREEGGKGLGVVAGLFMCIAFIVPIDFAIYPFGAAIFFAVISYFTTKSSHA